MNDRTIRRYGLLFTALIAAVFIISCDLDGGPSQTARYTVTFTSAWSESTHPDNFPSNPHFSGLIGATHNSDAVFWNTGETASAGMEQMAESGAKEDLTVEVNDAISAGTAENLLSGDGIGLSPGSVSLDFTVSLDHSRVSLVTMIAPSPDWFVGVSGYDLFQNGQWVAEATVDLFAYDAGTDSGGSYTAANSDTDPKEAVFKLETGVFEVNGSVPALGTFTFIKQ